MQIRPEDVHVPFSNVDNWAIAIGTPPVSNGFTIGTPPTTGSNLMERSQNNIRLTNSPFYSKRNEQHMIDAIIRGAESEEVPKLITMIDFFNLIFTTAQIESECIIIALIYCERLVKDSNGQFFIRHDNWRSVIFISLIMASKVWDDLSMSNADLSMILVHWDLPRVNELELITLKTLQFGVKIPPGQYAKYYFILRSLINQLNLAPDLKADELAPLDLAQVSVLSNRNYAIDSNIRAQNRNLCSEDLYKTNLKCNNQGASNNGSFGIVGLKGVIKNASLEDLLSGSAHTDADGSLHTTKTKTKTKTNTNTNTNTSTGAEIRRVN
jgi:hypothetical protein